jgi:hypothetical protein
MALPLIMMQPLRFSINVTLDGAKKFFDGLRRSRR